MPLKQPELIDRVSPAESVNLPGDLSLALDVRFRSILRVCVIRYPLTALKLDPKLSE
jgi:hypothetical protein